MIKKQKLILIDFLAVLVTLLVEENLSNESKIELIRVITYFVLFKISLAKKSIFEQTDLNNDYIKVFVVSLQDFFPNSNLICLFNDNIIENLKEFEDLEFFLINFVRFFIPIINNPNSSLRNKLEELKKEVYDN
jgi:hypothetical protein